MQFYPADWLQDTQVLTLEAQGAWMKLLCAMWIAPERGLVTFKKRDLNVFLANSNDDQTHQITVDLDNVANIEWRDKEGNYCDTWEFTCEIIFKCRRMIREEAERKRGLEADRRYREGQTSKKRPKNVSKTSKIYQKSEVRSHTSEEDKKEKKEQFAVFWNAYPNKIAKADAEKAWHKIRFDNGLFEHVIEALELHKKSTKWLKDKGDFIPNPATWLNGKRWDDQVKITEDDQDEIPGMSIWDEVRKK